MGLDIVVGILPDVREDDQEACQHLKQQFEAINEALRRAKLPEHREPEKLSEGITWSCQMHGYSGIHYLRRIAAHLWAGRELPPPGDASAADDPLLQHYFGPPTGLKGWWSYFRFLIAKRKSRMGRRFDHLINHSDAEGFYLPVRFQEVLVPDETLGIDGWMIGSSHMLLEECEALASALELPLDLDPESEEVWDAADAQGQGNVRWKQYGIESFSCLRLHYASRMSLKLGAAIVFT